MKKIITAFIFYFLIGKCFSQAGMWIWIKGSNLPNSTAVYGTQGIPAATNTPAALYEAAEWTDQAGNFWLFGGLDLNNESNGDLWKYDPSTNNWTWMKGTALPDDSGSFGTQGISSPANNPPALRWGVATWTGQNGMLWLYGGYAPSIGYMNDLWKYEISTNEWTWVHGAATASAPAVYGTQGIPSPLNTPGASSERSSTWVDSTGALWMFGGIGNGNLNALWKYDVTTNQWAWMKGASFADQQGSYGVQGVAAASNHPGARMSYSSWKDANENFWLFGGYFYITMQNKKAFNDMWKYNPASNMWTWMSGTNLPDDNGSYNNLCTPQITYTPASRNESRARWTTACGNFWLYGGYGSDNFFTHNDLWTFDPVTLHWTWADGDSTTNHSPVYGAIGIPSPTNQPGSRGGSNAWVSTAGELYLFGGADNGLYNDLWKYVPDTNCGGCNLQTSVKENNFTNQLIVFPNPANSTFTISFQSSTKQNIELRIYNTLGKQVYFSKEEITKGEFIHGDSYGEKEINVEKWSNGIYFLQVKTKEGNINRKVIINH